MNQTRQPTPPEDDVPLELQDAARLADRLGKSARDSAPPGLEDRILIATRPLISGGPKPILFPAEATTVVRGVRWRMAAAVLMVGTVGLSVIGWRVLNPSAGTSPYAPPAGHPVDVAALEADLESLFASASEWGGSTSDLALLSNDVDAAAGASDPWSAADSGIDELVEEGAL